VLHFTLCTLRSLRDAAVFQIHAGARRRKELSLHAGLFASLRSFAPSREPPEQVRSTSPSASRSFAVLRGSPKESAPALRSRLDLTRRSEGAKNREGQARQQQPRTEHTEFAEKVIQIPLCTLRSLRDAAVFQIHAGARRRKELSLHAGLFASLRSFAPSREPPEQVRSTSPLCVLDWYKLVTHQSKIQNLKSKIVREAA
jgi:hypothetical protein